MLTKGSERVNKYPCFPLSLISGLLSLISEW